MTSPFVAPNGRGVVPDRLGVSTGNLKNIATRAVMKEIGRTVINNSGNVQGMINPGVDLAEAMNLGKNAVRRVAFVTVSGDAVNESTLAHCTGLHLATSSNDDLYDEVTQQSISPAGNALHNGVVSRNEHLMTMIRKYDSETRLSQFQIPAIGVNKIKQIQAALSNQTPVTIGRSQLNNSVLDEKRKAEAATMIKTLHQILSMKIETAKTSMMMGVEQSLFNAVTRHAVDTALLRVVEDSIDSLVQTSVGGDVNIKLREKNVYTSFARAYCNKLVSDMFIMAKRPKDFVQILSDISDKFSRSMVSTKSVDPDAVVIARDGTTLPITKVLVVGETVLSQIIGLESGRRTGMIPIGFYDNTKFYERSNRPFLLSNEDGKQVEPGSVVSGVEMMSLIKGDNSNIDGNLAALTPLAERILNLNKSAEEKDLTADDSKRLYSVPLEDNCHFVRTGNGAVLINTRKSTRFPGHNNQGYEVSASGKMFTNIMTTTQMGDVDYNDVMLISWGDLVADGKVAPSTALKRFGLNDVTSRIETLSDREVRFTKSHFAQAIADPSLWTYSVESLDNLNNFLTTRTERLTNMNDVRNLVTMITQLFREKTKMMKMFYTLKTRDLAQKLSFTELSPFHDYFIEGRERTISHSQRKHVGGFPAWVVDWREHIRFANIAMESKELLQRLTENSASASELIKILKEVAQRMYSKVAKLDDVIELSDAALTGMVIYPATLGSAGYKFTSEAVTAGGDGKGWEGKAATGAGKNFTAIHHANVEMIADDLSIRKEVKMLIFLGMLRKMSPAALVENVKLGLPFGLGLDIHRVERMYSNPAYITTHNAVDAIITPLPTKSHTLGDGSMVFDMQTRVQTVNNMAGGSSIVVPNAFPSLRTDHVATDFGENPIISMDHITTSKYAGGLEHWLTAMETRAGFSKAETEVVRNVNAVNENMRIQHMKARGVENPPESYVLLLRPGRDLADTTNLTPFMGTGRYNCVVGNESQMPFINFYTTAETNNPWLSRLGAVYNQRYVHGRQVITSMDGRTSIKMDTTTINPMADNLCDTTRLFYDAFNFATYSHSDLDPFQERVVGNMLNYHGGAGARALEAIENNTQPAKAVYLSKFHTLSRMGMSVPATTFSNKTVLDNTRKMEKRVFSSENGQCVLSPLAL